MNKTKLNMPFCLYLKYMLCGKRYSNLKESSHLLVYNEQAKYINHVFDALTYVKLYTEIQHLKSIFLSQIQVDSMMLLPIPPERKKEVSEEVAFSRVCEYYKNLNNNYVTGRGGNDKAIFDLMCEKSKAIIKGD